MSHTHVESMIVRSDDDLVTDDDLARLTQYYVDDAQDVNVYAELLTDDIPPADDEPVVTFALTRYAPNFVVLTRVIVSDDRETMIDRLADEPSCVYDADLHHMIVYPIFEQIDDEDPRQDVSEQTMIDWA